MDLKYFSRYNKLAKIAVESLRNSFRLHQESYILCRNRSYSTAFVLSVLATEEFGKFLIYLDLAWDKVVGQGNIPAEYIEDHKKFISETMGSHKRKLQAVLWKHFDGRPKNLQKKFEKLHQERLSALYVGVSRKTGHVVLPKKFLHRKTRAQISFLNNDVFLYCSKGVKEMSLDYDLLEVNQFFRRIYLRLTLIRKKMKAS